MREILPEFWKRLCVVLHEREVQSKVLWENVVVIKEESNKGEVNGLSRHTEEHSANENEASEEEILSWVRSVRIFKKRPKISSIQT